MSDQRFKELLNLYLDHRLSDAEAVELEQSLRADAGRRKVCGTTPSFRAAAPSSFRGRS